jgi:hypothetical protein
MINVFIYLIGMVTLYVKVIVNKNKTQLIIKSNGGQILVVFIYSNSIRGLVIPIQ